MLDKIQDSDILPNFIKIFIPAAMGVGIKIAVEMKKGKITIVNAVLSLFIGISGAWLLSAPIESVCSQHYVPAAIAFVAIIADKVGEFLIYKLNVDVFLTSLTNNFFEFISKSFKK